MKNILINITIMFCFLVAFYHLIDWYFGLPIVKESYTTGYCVEVINFREEDKYSCENMPVKFHHIWVE